MKILQYKNFLGNLEYDKNDNVYIGQILGIDPYCPFFGDTEEEAKKDFIDSCEAYIDFTKDNNKQLQCQSEIIKIG